ncbi:MAG: osmoprotectant transporter permease [Bacteroidota bacterium]
MIFFWTLWAIDAIATAVILHFFVIGLGDGSISSANAGIWALLVIIPIALLLGSYMLKKSNNLIAAKWVPGILAIPSLLYFLFFLFIIIANPRWN